MGPVQTLRGSVRYARLRVRGPEQAVVELRSSGISLEFAYPSQCNPALVVFGDLIDPEFPLLATIMRPGGTVVDVGAAIGQFTMFAARQGAAVVHAVEPSSANCHRLQANAERNGVDDRVVVHQLALSAVPGEATFATADSTFVSGLATASPDGETVRVDTLTNLCAELGIEHIGVLKINVAGYEPAVLEGADAFLAKGGADVLILLLGLDSLPIYARLHEQGYRFFFFHPRRETLHEVDNFEAEVFLASRPSPARNVVAIRDAALSELLAGRVRLAG